MASNPADHKRAFLGAMFGAAVTGLIGFAFSRTADPGNLYGEAVFCGLPLLTGCAGSLILGPQHPPTVKDACFVGLYSYLIVCAGLVCCAQEGVVCLLMAAPLAIPLCMLGAIVGAGILTWVNQKFLMRSTLAVVPLLPLSLFMAAHQTHAPAVRTESTTIVIDAPPSKVWPLLFNMDSDQQPLWALFRMGIAYPKGTRSDGLKVGSSRHCLLSTGVMNEVITDLVPNQLFRFRILNTPPTMHEWNPFFQIDTRHLSGYMHCRYGEFRLRALPGGKTELTGLSEYDQEIYPALYWFLWSDSVVEQVHQRAMGGIKAAAESRP